MAMQIGAGHGWPGTGPGTFVFYQDLAIIARTFMLVFHSMPSPAKEYARFMGEAAFDSHAFSF
jgi:hypothetical protein